MSVFFTQFLMPDGRVRPVTIDLPSDIEALARDVMRAGCRFEAEVLSTGAVSFEVVRDVLDPDICDIIAIEICGNGPEVPTAVTKLIKDAAHTLKLEIA